MGTSVILERAWSTKNGDGLYSSVSPDRGDHTRTVPSAYPTASRPSPESDTERSVTEGFPVAAAMTWTPSHGSPSKETSTVSALAAAFLETSTVATKIASPIAPTSSDLESHATRGTSEETSAGGGETVIWSSAFSSTASPPSPATTRLTKRQPSTPNDARMSSFALGANFMSAICAVCPRRSARDAVSL